MLRLVVESADDQSLSFTTIQVQRSKDENNVSAASVTKQLQLIQSETLYITNYKQNIINKLRLGINSHFLTKNDAQYVGN